MDSAVEYAGRVEQCRCLLATMLPQQIVEVLQEQMTFEVEEMGESELERGLIELLWDYDVMAAHVATSTQIDSSALLEAMDFRTDALVLAALVDEEWRSPTSEDEDSKALTPQMELLIQLIGDIKVEDVCRLLQPHISVSGGNNQPLVQPLGRALADVFYSEEYLYEAIAQNGFLDAEPLKLAMKQRPDVILLVALPLEETFAEVLLQPYIQRLLSIDLDQIKHHAKVYGVELSKKHWNPINRLLEHRVRDLQVQIEAAYRSSLNPCNDKAFESLVVLQVTQFRLSLDIALGTLFSNCLR